MKKNQFKFPNWLLLVALIPVAFIIKDAIVGIVTNNDHDTVDSYISIAQLIISAIGFYYIVATFRSQQLQINEQKEITSRQLIDSGFQNFLDGLNRVIDGTSGKRIKLKVKEGEGIDKIEGCELTGTKYFDFLYDQLRDLHKALRMDTPNEQEVYAAYKTVFDSFNPQAVEENYQFRKNIYNIKICQITPEQIQEYRRSFVETKSFFILGLVDKYNQPELVSALSAINYVVIYLAYWYDEETQNADEAKIEFTRRHFLNYILTLKALIPKSLLLYYFYKNILRRSSDDHFVYSLLFSDIHGVELLDKDHAIYLPMKNYFPKIMVTDNPQKKP